MVIPNIRGTRVQLSEIDFACDYERIPALHISEHIVGHKEHLALLRAALRKIDMVPSADFRIGVTESVDAPGGDLRFVLEAMRASSGEIADLDELGAMVWGSISPVDQGLLINAKGTFAVACLARDSGYTSIVIPRDAYHPLLGLIDIDVVAVDDLPEFVRIARDWSTRRVIERVVPTIEDHWVGCISQIEGCELGKLALEVMLAGRHSCLFETNDPILPAFPRLLRSCAPLIERDIEEILSLRSLIGLRLSTEDLFPIRQPHHTASRQAMLGSRWPGEVSLAHRGVLVLNHADRFPVGITRDVLQVANEGIAYIADNGRYLLELAAAFTLFCTAYECRCGKHPCTDSSTLLELWRDRMRPYRERCEIQVDPTQRLDAAEIGYELTSMAMRGRIQDAREIVHETQRPTLEETVAALDGRRQVSARDQHLASRLRRRK